MAGETKVQGKDCLRAVKSNLKQTFSKHTIGNVFTFKFKIIKNNFSMMNT